MRSMGENQVRRHKEESEGAFLVTQDFRPDLQWFLIQVWIEGSMSVK